MPFLFAAARIVISVLIIGFLGTLSFLGIEHPEAKDPSLAVLPPVSSDLTKLGGEEVDGVPILPTLQEEDLPIAPVEPEKIGSGTGGSEVGSPPPAQNSSVAEEPPPPFVETPVQPSFSEVNTTTRAALVNILCTSGVGGPLRPISGSGVVIDERGVILTNAHVAQFLLLKDYPTKDSLSCAIRTGSPAYPAYRVSLLFFPEAWLLKNAHLIVSDNPLGTGENDYALLLITGAVGVTPLPSSFPFISPELSPEAVELGESVLVAGYPAGFLSGSAIQRDLYAASAVTTVQELFTFVADTLDLFSIGGSVVAQQGSSGGAVVNTENKLLGIIVTSSTAESTDDRDLRAVTLGHVNRSIQAHTGHDLAYLLFGDLRVKTAAFSVREAPALTKLLTDVLTE